MQGCITKDDPSSPELRVVNLKSFYLGISPAPGGPGYPPPTVLAPGEAAQFTADTSDQSPVVVYADFTEEAMWRFVAGLAARMVPGGDLVPNEGLAFIADGLQRVLSAQQVSDDLDAGDSRGAAEGIYELITGDKFIETFVKLATEYGQKHGVDMMTKWTEAGIAEVFMGVAAVDVIASATDFLANYILNNHSELRFSWAMPSGGPVTPSAASPVPAPAGVAPGVRLDCVRGETKYACLSFRVADFTDESALPSPNFPDVSGLPSPGEDSRLVGIDLDTQYDGGLLHEGLLGAEIRLRVPSQGEFPLDVSWGTSPAYSVGVAVVPGFKARLHLYGVVPKAVGTIAGATIHIKGVGELGIIEYEADVPLERGIRFTHGPLARAALSFGTTIPTDPHYPGGVQGAFTVTGVSSSSPGHGPVAVTYQWTNRSPFRDFSPMEGPQREGFPRIAVLLDANGYPYVLGAPRSSGEPCDAEPGQTVECVLETFEYSAPPSQPPDLSDVLIILRDDLLPLAEGAYVFDQFPSPFSNTTVDEGAYIFRGGAR
jgi:hypothetical protein